MSRLPPSKMLDSMFYEQERYIANLEAEIIRLKTENSRLISENVICAQQLSQRTLYMALKGCLPKPGTPDHDALGYGSLEQKG